MSTATASRPTADEIRHEVRQGYIDTDADITAGLSEVDKDRTLDIAHWREIEGQTLRYRGSEGGFLSDPEADALRDRLVAEAQAAFRDWLTERLAVELGA